MAYRKGEGDYNAIAIGAGSAGLITTAILSGLGARVALIERNLMGGDCLNFGCVPSKGLIASARLIQNIRESHRWGLDPQEPQFQFEKIFESMRARRDTIASNDSQERYERLGVDVFRGHARFISPHEIEVEGQRLKAKNFVITAGSRARIPDIEGIQDVPYFTNETIFDKLKSKPESLVIIGGGPIGCELGQAFNRMGVKVCILEVGAKILSREDPDITTLILERFKAEGMQFHFGVRLQRIIYQDGNHHLTCQIPQPDGSSKIETLQSEALLLATGRVPNLENLKLEDAGVQYHPRGIHVNQSLQTTQPHIYAAGDIAGLYQFTHVADYHARLVVENIIRRSIAPLRWFNLLAKADYRCLPWSTYTSPEIGRVGLNESQAKKRGIPYDLYTIPMKEIDRAIVENDAEGLAKVLTKKGKDTILGATVLCERGGDIVHEFALAMKHGIGLSRISKTIHAYPTFAEVVRKSGDSYNKSRLTPKKHAWLKKRFQSQIRA